MKMKNDLIVSKQDRTNAVNKEFEAFGLEVLTEEEVGNVFGGCVCIETTYSGSRV